MWVIFADLIICARFYLYRPNSFWAADPQKLGVPIDLKSDFYNKLWNICRLFDEKHAKQD